LAVERRRKLKSEGNIGPCTGVQTAGWGGDAWEKNTLLCDLLHRGKIQEIIRFQGSTQNWYFVYFV
jgi:hypothetical protein